LENTKINENKKQRAPSLFLGATCTSSHFHFVPTLGFPVQGNDITSVEIHTASDFNPAFSKF
jgi:hypothetical protein